MIPPLPLLPGTPSPLWSSFAGSSPLCSKVPQLSPLSLWVTVSKAVNTFCIKLRLLIHPCQITHRLTSITDKKGPRELDDNSAFKQVAFTSVPTPNLKVSLAKVSVSKSCYKNAQSLWIIICKTHGLYLIQSTSFTDKQICDCSLFYLQIQQSFDLQNSCLPRDLMTPPSKLILQL